MDASNVGNHAVVEVAALEELLDVVAAALEELLDVVVAALEELLDVVVAALEELLDVVVAALEELLVAVPEVVVVLSLPPPQAASNRLPSRVAASADFAVLCMEAICLSFCRFAENVCYMHSAELTDTAMNSYSHAAKILTKLPTSSLQNNNILLIYNLKLQLKKQIKPSNAKNTNHYITIT